MCDSREQAEAALARLTGLLADLGLEPRRPEPALCTTPRALEGSDFLGFRRRLVRGWSPEIGAPDLPCSLALT